MIATTFKCAGIPYNTPGCKWVIAITFKYAGAPYNTPGCEYTYTGDVVRVIETAFVCSGVVGKSSEKLMQVYMSNVHPSVLTLFHMFLMRNSQVIVVLICLACVYFFSVTC